MILAIYGASGLGAEYYNFAKRLNALQNRWEQILFADDDPAKNGTLLEGRPIMSFAQLTETHDKNQLEFVISVGEPAIKDIIYNKLKANGCRLTNLIYPDIAIPESVQLGEGIVIKQGTFTIPPMAVLGNNVLIQSPCALGHNIVLGDNVVISSFCFVGGDTTIGKDTYIGPHACLRNGIKIGEGAVIGMGSVVTKDIPDRAVAYGNPCEVRRINEKGRVFSK